MAKSYSNKVSCMFFIYYAYLQFKGLFQRLSLWPGHGEMLLHARRDSCHSNHLCTCPILRNKMRARYLWVNADVAELDLSLTVEYRLPTKNNVAVLQCFFYMTITITILAPVKELSKYQNAFTNAKIGNY